MTIAVAEGLTESLAVEHRGGFRRRWYRTPSFVAGVLIKKGVQAAAEPSYTLSETRAGISTIKNG